MKFTKEEAHEKLVGILTNGGRKTLRMSEKSVERQLETLIPLIAGEEMGLDEFVEKVKASFEVMNSNAENDNSAFVAKWKREHQKKDDDKGDDDDSRSYSLPPQFSEMMEELKKLKERAEKEDRETMLMKVRKGIKARLKEKGADDEWCDMVLSEVHIDNDTDIDSKTETLLRLYNRQESRVNRNVGPVVPTGAEERYKDALANLRKLRENRDRKPDTE